MVENVGKEHESKRKNIYLLSIVSFLNDLSSEIILPILPFFLKSLGTGYLGVGLIGGIIDGFSNIAKVLSGYISDRIGRRKILVFLGYFISQVSKFGLSASPSSAYAGFFVTVDRIGKGIRTSPRDAILSESSRKSGKAFGFHRAMDTAGAVLGTLISLLLIYSGFTYSKAIFIAALIGFLALIPLYFVRDTGRKVERAGIDVKILRFSTASFFFGLSGISYMFFLLKAGNFGIIFALSLYLLFNVIYMLFSYPAGNYAEQRGKRDVLFLGYLFLTSSSILMLSSEKYLLVPAFILYGLYMSIVEGQQRALASDLSSSKGIGLGSYHFMYGSGIIAGNIIAGFFAQFSLNMVFIYSSIMSFLSALIYRMLKF